MQGKGNSTIDTALEKIILVIVLVFFIAYDQMSDWKQCKAVWASLCSRFEGIQLPRGQDGMVMWYSATGILGASDVWEDQEAEAAQEMGWSIKL